MIQGLPARVMVAANLGELDRQKKNQKMVVIFQVAETFASIMGEASAIRCKPTAVSVGERSRAPRSERKKRAF